MSLAARTARSLSLTSACQGAQFLLQLGTASVLGRTIAPADYGVFALAGAATGMVTVCRDFGIGQAAIRREALTDGDWARLHWISVGIAVASGVAVAAVAPLVPLVLSNDRLPALVLALAGPVVIAGFGVMPGVRLSREHRFRELALLSFAAAILGMATAVALALAGLGVWALVGQVWAVALANVAGLWWRAPVPLRGGPGAGVRPVLAHGVWLAGSEVVWMAEGHLQRGILGSLLDEHALGQLQRPKDIIDMPLRMFSAPLTSVGLPVLASLLSDQARFQRAVLRIGGGAELLLTVPIALMIGCAQDGLRLLLGPQWVAASQYCFWLAFLSVGQGGLLPLQWLLVLRAAGRLQVLLQVVSTVLVLAGAGLGAWRYGALGSVSGLLCAYGAVVVIRSAAILPVAGIASATWVRQHVPLWGVQVVAGVLAHAAARAVGEVGSWTSLSVGALVATAVGALGLLGPRGPRQRLREALAILRQRPEA